VLRRAGYRLRPRLGWRGAGLRTAGGLAAWTIGLVLVNQVAYAVIVRLATGVNAVSADAGSTPAGLTAYTNAHLMFVLPHSVITVSLVAALLPRMSRAAHELRFGDLAADISTGMRSASALIIPASVALVVLGTQAGVLLFNYGQTSNESARVTGLLASVFALALLPFTLYYVVLRGWYALERTRTAFWVTVVLNSLNLAIAVPLYRWVSSQQTGPAALVALAVGYVAAYWLTLVVAWFVLSRQIGGLNTAATLRSLARMALAGLATLLVMVLGLSLLNQVAPGSTKLAAALRIVLVGGVGGLTYLGMARLLRIDEVTDVLATLRRRVPIGR
jgi:putative peptidoglycan lipid II flippase